MQLLDEEVPVAEIEPPDDLLIRAVLVKLIEFPGWLCGSTT